MGNSNGKPVVFTDEGKSHHISLIPRLFPFFAPAPSPIVRQHPLTSRNKSVNLNHFRLLRVVGKGAFGKVRIVERKDTGLTFALKYIRKDEGVQVHRVN